MTLIVGYKYNGIVYMAADSAIGFSNAAQSLDIQGVAPKLFARDGMIFGATGTPRASQLVRHRAFFEQPSVGEDPGAFMVKSVAEGIRTCLVNNGHIHETDKEQEIPARGAFLIAYRGRLFQLYADFQVIETDEPFAAIGKRLRIRAGCFRGDPAPALVPAAAPGSRAGRGGALLSLRAGAVHFRPDAGRRLMVKRRIQGRHPTGAVITILQHGPGAWEFSVMRGERRVKTGDAKSLELAKLRGRQAFDRDAEANRLETGGRWTWREKEQPTLTEASPQDILAG